jgi:hypothetical protein
MISGQKWERFNSLRNYALREEPPTIFSGLLEAGDSLVSHWHVASYPSSNQWSDATEKIPALPQEGAWQKKSMSILARWTSAYDAYLNIPGENLTDTRKKGTAALRILKELGSSTIMLKRTVVHDEGNWDVFCPMFQKIVSLAEDMVELDQKPTAERPTYCINMAIVAPLFMVSLLSKKILLVQRSRRLYE